MPEKKAKDTLFSPPAKIPEFQFDENVARVFDDMLNRSIPFYNETQAMALRLARNFVKRKTRIYDLGCSTGTVLKNFAEEVSDNTVKLIGIDNSPAMLNRAKQKLRPLLKEKRVELWLKSLDETFDLRNASVVIMNYTLQFVRPLHREALMGRIHHGLVDNGALILLEKVLGNDSLFNRLYIELYYEFKKRQGYSDGEIHQKREALENILIPYRIEENIELMKKCGFENIDVFFKWYNFAGIIAVKSRMPPR